MEIAIINTNTDPRYLKKYVLDVFLSKNITVTVIDSNITDKTSANDILNEVTLWSKFGYFFVYNAKLFKTLTKVRKSSDYIGHVLDIGNNQHIVYSPNPNTVFTNPKIIINSINTAIEALCAHVGNTYTQPGIGIIHYEYYPITPKEIESALQDLLKRNVPLTIDIETLSLKHYSAGIASVTLCWSQHEGLSFPVDYYGYNPTVRKLLLNFLVQFKNKLIYHNSVFDAHILIYQLFMDELVDIKGLLYGLETLTSNFEDTKLIAYLCLNSTARPLLSLKELAKPFSGKYALDDSAITNVRSVPLDELLRYNLIDGLSTWYVYNTYAPKLITENQVEIYEEIFKPAAIDLIHTQLIGMPVDPVKVKEAKIQLKELIQESLTTLQSTDFIKDTESYIKTQWVIMKNNTLKVKRVTVNDCKETFNPNSDKHVQILLYMVMGFTATTFTDTGQPSTSGDALLDLKIKANPEQKYVLEHLIKIGEASKILSTFTPALEKAICAEDGNTYLYGNFNLGSTVSGRLSSSDPNLQQIPANSTYGKLIKSCFISTENTLFCGVDFNSLT